VSRRSLRQLLRIARWEVSRGVGVIDRKTAAVGVVLLLLTGGVVGGVVMSGAGGVAIDRDIYRVGVDTENPYYPVVAQSSQLSAHPPDHEALARGDQDVIIEAFDDQFITWQTTGTEKGDAAHAALLSEIDRYNERQMASEPNQTAAYPVLVDIQYLTRFVDTPEALAAAQADDTSTSDRDLEGDTDSGSDRDTGAETNGEQPDSGAETSGGTDTASGPPPAIGTGVFGGEQSGSPATIQPPFPFSSLLLAFVFLIPLNFVIQAYGSTILNERINRRGELLLVAPVSRRTIIAGKTLPYFTAGMGVCGIIAVAVGGGLQSIAGVLPIVLAFLSATFVGGMLARSFKELTFVTVTISVFITTYVFVPAIFTNVTPIALISPLTIVVMDLQGQSATMGELLFSTVPFVVGSVVLFALGAGTYREEDMFTQKSIPDKFLDALNAQLSGYRSVALWTALFVPFVFVAELLAIAVLFVAPIELSIPILLITIAAIEEIAKSIHIYAGYQRARFDRALPVALGLGIASGAAFFVAEKFTAIAQVVGLPELALGQAAFAPVGLTPTLTIGLLLAPLALHVVTAMITAVGARDSRLVYGSALFIATLVHALYNYVVVTFYA